MRVFSREPKLSPTLATLTELSRDSVSVVDRSDLDRGLSMLHSRLAKGRARRRATWGWSLVGAGALASVLTIWQVTRSSAGELVTTLAPLSYAVEGGRVLDGGYLREVGRDGVTLRFSEGTELGFAPGARGRIRSVTSEGTRIAVDSGKASLRITPNPARHWWIESGPFVVTVRGTVFDVSWEPSVERFELDLHDGHVTVEGPVSGGRLALQKGQRLVVNLAKSETVITEGTFPESATESSDSMARDGAATSRPTPSATMPQAASASPPAIKAPVAAAEVAPTRSWAEHLANGNWDHILSEVNRLGVDAALNQASSADLNALADAARYRHRIDLARDALLAQRRRFPSSSRAIDALFLLGRVEESRSGATTRALGWYDEYLKRAPSGSFAAEALGRKMVILNQTSSAAQARTLAEAYLSRFPEGSYAGAARAILRVR